MSTWTTVVLLAVSLPASALAQAPPTFNRDIAPIVFERCATCHVEGGAGPFGLTSYADVRQHATQIAYVTANRLMPPWPTAPGDGPFVGQHPLNESEVELIRHWVAAGAPEGNPGDLPPPPQPSGGWRLGEPDLVLTTAGPYTLRADGPDVFRIFTIPVPLTGERYVKGLEFKPSNPAVVHHANIRVDRTLASRQYDEEDPAPGYEGLIPHSATFPDGHFLGWTPAQVPPLLPKGLAWTLRGDSDLVVEIHMQPSGQEQVVQPSIGLYFGDDPPERTPIMLRLGRQTIDIPPGEARYTIGDSFVVPVDVEVQALQPHAHYRAREVTGTATLPDGSTRQLIHIANWDFRWQHVYRFVEPFWLPRGTTVSMEWTFDNSAENPRNPIQPPQRVYWGQRSRDEMGDLWIQVLTRDEPALRALHAEFAPKVMAEDAIGLEREIERDPTRVALHDDAAVLYLALGRPHLAVSHFARSARLKPGSAATHYNLGTALSYAGRLDDALQQFRLALDLRPDYALAHNNLGGLLLQQGAATAALPHLLEAVRLDPLNPQPLANLAAAQAAVGDLAAAVRASEEALALAPLEPLASTLQQGLEQYRRLQSER